MRVSSGELQRRAAFRAGVAAMLPPAVGVGAWGLVTGVAMAQSTLSVPQALVFMLLAFAGSAQLATLPLLALPAPVWITTLTALVVNLRFIIYSVALARPFRHLPFRRRLWMSYLIGDVPFALYARRFAAEPDAPDGDAYFAGIILSNWLVWQVCSFVGYALGSRVPRAWGLELAGTLALVALLVPMVRQRLPTAIGVAVTAVAAVLSFHAPLRLGVLIATVLGVASAMVADRLLGAGQGASGAGARP